MIQYIYILIRLPILLVWYLFLFLIELAMIIYYLCFSYFLLKILTQKSGGSFPLLDPHPKKSGEGGQDPRIPPLGTRLYFWPTPAISVFHDTAFLAHLALGPPLFFPASPWPNPSKIQTLVRPKLCPGLSLTSLILETLNF